MYSKIVKTKKGGMVDNYNVTLNLISRYQFNVMLMALRGETIPEKDKWVAESIADELRAKMNDANGVSNMEAGYNVIDKMKNQ